MRVAALQMNSGTEPGPNLAALAALAKEAAAQGAVYALSPEVTVVFAENRDGLRAVAGPWENNPAIARCAEIARETGLWLHLGSLAVALPDGRFANRSVLFHPDGVVAATYDKIHLFDATLPGVREYRESETYAGGDRAVVQYRGSLMPLETIDYASGPLPDRGTRPALVFYTPRGPFGIIVERIVDVVEADITPRIGKQRGEFLGTAVIAGKATEIVDIDQFANRAWPEGAVDRANLFAHAA